MDSSSYSTSRPVYVFFGVSTTTKAFIAASMCLWRMVLCFGEGGSDFFFGVRFGGIVGVLPYVGVFEVGIE